MIEIWSNKVINKQRKWMPKSFTWKISTWKKITWPSRKEIIVIFHRENTLESSTTQKMLILHYLNSLPAQVVHKHHEKKRHLQSSNFDLHRSNLTLEVMMRPPSKFRTDWKWFAFPINGWYHTTHSKKLLRCSFILLFDCCSRSLYLSSIFCWKSILPAVTCYYCLPVITKILILSFYVSFLINKP